MADEPHSDHPRPAPVSAVARPWLIVGFIVIVLLVGAGAFWAGGRFVTPESVAVDASDSRIPVDVAVESRTIAASTTVQGQVNAGTTMTVEAVRPSTAARAVVTGTNVAAGATVTAGTLIATVSGRPVIVLPMPVPLYRNLVRGDEGDDVSALQIALAKAGLEVEDTGWVDWQTQQGIRDLYDAVGFVAPGGEGAGAFVDLQELVQIPGDSATVAQIAPVGTILGSTAAVAPSGAAPTTTNAPTAAGGSSTDAPQAADDPADPAAAAADPFAAGRAPGSGTGETLATLQIAPDTIVARATVLEYGELPVGATVTVVGAGGARVESTVSMVGEFTTGTTSGGGYDITVTLPPDTGFTVGQSVTVTTSTGGEPVPAVPLVAVSQDDGKTYVQPAPENGSMPGPRVEVTLTDEADGWAAFVPIDALAVGTKLRVGP